MAKTIDTDEFFGSALRLEPMPWPKGADTDAVMQQAKTQGLIALLYHIHSQHDVCAAWPASLLDRIQSFARHAAANELLLEDEVRRCLGVLADRGVNALLTKGVSLGYRHYPAPSLRPRCDTDLFIAEQDKATAARALRDSGYRRLNSAEGDLLSQQVMFTRSLAHGVVHNIDVHWRLFNPHVLANVLDFSTAYHERVSIPALGPHACGLSTVHALLHACLHRIAHHGDEEDRLIWLYDMHLLCDAMDSGERERFIHLCRESGTATACAEALRACQAVLPATELAIVLQALARDRGPRDIPLNKLIGARHLDYIKHDLSALPTLRLRTRLLWQHAFPSAQYMRKRYQLNSRGALPWYYLKRLYHGALKLNRPRSAPSP